MRKVRHLTLSDLYIRELIGSGDASIARIDSIYNGSDVLTKVMLESKLVHLLHRLNLYD